MATHPDLYKSLAFLLERSVPGFVKTDHETFIAFLEAYFTWMEETGKAQEVITQFSDYKDIDNTIEEFLEYFRVNYFQTIPKNVLVDKRLLAKHVRDLYSTKGAVPAYKLLFRIVFNQNVEVSYPGDDILRASDGRWIEERVIRTTSTIPGDIGAIISSTQITGEDSTAVAIVESAIRTQHSTNGKIFKNFMAGDVPDQFVRSGVATRYNAVGDLEVVPENTPRQNYDPITLAYRGIQIEPPRENKILYSNELGNVAAWIAQRSIVFSNIIQGPSGLFDADKLADTITNGTHYLSQIFAVTNTNTYSYSIYARKEELEYVQLKFTNAHFDDNAYATFNLINGTIHDQGTGLIQAKIVPAKYGYYRLSITATADTTAPISQVFVYLYDKPTESITYNATGGKGLYLSCAQLEIHDVIDAPTSYIPTSGAPVTRGNEYGVYPDMENVFSFNRGTLYLDIEKEQGTNNEMDMFYVGTTASDDSYLLRVNLDTNFEVALNIGGISSTIIVGDSNINVPFGLRRFGYGYQSNDHSATFGGNGIFGTNTSLDVPEDLNFVYIGKGPNNTTFHGHLRAWAFYIERQSNATMTAVTSPSGNLESNALPIITELYLSNIFGNFEAGERIRFVDKDGNVYANEVTYPIYDGFTINNPGTNYQVNDEVRVVEVATNIVVAAGNITNVTPTGQIRTISMSNFGIVLPGTTTVQIVSQNGTGASLTPRSGVLGEFAGRWVGTYGQLSSDKRLQDNLFYQDYSYVLRSSVNVDTFNDIVKEIIHPAGFQLFGELFSEETSVNSINIHNLTLDTFRIIERLKVINMRIGIADGGIIKLLERIIDEPFGLVESMDKVKIIQRWKMKIGEYETIKIGAAFDDINEGATPDITHYKVGSLQLRPALHDVRKFSMIQTIEP